MNGTGGSAPKALPTKAIAACPDGNERLASSMSCSGAAQNEMSPTAPAVRACQILLATSCNAYRTLVS